MPPLVLVALLLYSCSGSEEAPPPAAAPVVEAPAPPPDPAVEARKLASSGRHEEALALAEKAVAAKPEDDALWRLLEREAIAAGQARALYDRLDAVKAIGDRVGPHHLLRAELALSAGLPGEAYAAAQAALPADADGGAAMMARAVLAGAPTPPVVEGAPLAGADALVAWLQAADAEAGAPNAAAALAIKGWRASLLRSEHQQKLGDLAAALAELATAAADPDPRGVIQGNLARARLVNTQKAASGASDSDAGTWALAAAEAAKNEGSNTDLASAIVELCTAWTRGGQAAAAVEKGRPLLTALSESGDGRASGQAGGALAGAAWRAGALSDALALATQARTALAGAGDTSGAAGVAWVEGISAYALGRLTELGAATEAATGAQQQALRALTALLQGDLPTAAASVPATGLADIEAISLFDALASADRAESLTWGQKAVDAADRLGDGTLRIQTRLRYEALARAQANPRAAAATRDQLAKLAPADAAGDPLRLELAARASIDGAKASFSATDTTVLASIWRALGSAASPPAAGDDPLADGVASWAQGRAAASSGQIEQVFSLWSEALGHLPLHRQGTLALGTALDGSQGLPLDADQALLASRSAPIASWMAMHELDHIVQRHRWETSFGVDYTASLPTEQREALLNAVARARASVAAWQAGQAAYPTEALRGVVEAEARLAKDGPMAGVLPKKMQSPDELVSKMTGLGIVSFRVANGHVFGAVLSKKGSLQLDLGPSARVMAAASAHVKALQAAVAQKSPTNPAPGDQLRKLLLDPFAGELSGVGRYLVIAPPELLAIPWATLPEQASGLRWLVDIRAIGNLPTLRALNTNPRTVETYRPDFLGFGDPARNEDVNATDDSSSVGNELRGASRVFAGGLRDVLSGAQSTVAAWKEKAPTARYIHFAQVPAAESTGFGLADGTLSTATIRGTPLAARLAVVTAPSSQDVALLRALALLDAGARGVVIGLWPLDDITRTRLMGSYYDALARDRTAARALTEARGQLSEDTVAGGNLDDPSIWGAMVLLGEP